MHLLIHHSVHVSGATQMYLLAMDGYRLDLISDYDVITLRRADDSIVCRFGMYATQEAVREVIAEDKGCRIEATGEAYTGRPDNMGVIFTKGRAVGASEQDTR